MGVETDYQNANIIVKRGDELVYTFKFIPFVPAAKIKAINDNKSVITKLYQQPASDEVQKELEKAEEKYFNTLMQTACDNPISHKDALDKFSVPEINSISEEAFIFLVNWSSIVEVKAYGLLQAKSVTEKNEQKSSTNIQT